MRGKPVQRDRPEVRQGSIPARAGETTKGICIREVQRVHPRACGGNRDALTVGVDGHGPSPRVRGKLRKRGLPQP